MIFSLQPWHLDIFLQTIIIQNSRLLLMSLLAMRGEVCKLSETEFVIPEPVNSCEISFKIRFEAIFCGFVAT